MVVPNSSDRLFTDGDYSLYNVVLFHKVVDEFKMHARENKFIVREFVYSEKALNAGKNELNRLESDKKKQLVIIKIEMFVCEFKVYMKRKLLLSYLKNFLKWFFTFFFFTCFVVEKF